MPFFDDDGNEINPDLFPKPTLCLSCRKNEDPTEDILCSLTRIDQIDESEFKCFAYEQIENTEQKNS